jgi:hypothetical protein
LLTEIIVAGGLINAVLLAIEAGLEASFLDGHNPTGTKAAVAMYFLFAFFYTCTIECTGYVYGCEIWPTYLRSQGATISYVGFFVTSIWTTAPAAQAFNHSPCHYYILRPSRGKLNAIPCVISVVHIIITLT